MHTRKAICCALLAALLLTTGYATAQQNDQTSAEKTQPGKKRNKLGVPTSNNPVKAPDETDKNFLKEAAIGDTAEIQLGQMAQEKASTPKVKQFGARMIKDHSQNSDELKGVAQTQHVSLPTELDPAHKAQKAELSNKTGAEFDKVYIRLMVQDHTKTVDKFKREAAASHDPTVKKYAQGSLPILESHLKQAKQIQSELKTTANK